MVVLDLPCLAPCVFSVASFSRAPECVNLLGYTKKQMQRASLCVVHNINYAINVLLSLLIDGYCG